MSHKLKISEKRKTGYFSVKLKGTRWNVAIFRNSVPLPEHAFVLGLKNEKSVDPRAAEARNALEQSVSDLGRFYLLDSNDEKISKSLSKAFSPQPLEKWRKTYETYDFYACPEPPAEISLRAWVDNANQSIR